MLGVRGKYQNLGKYMLEYTKNLTKEVKRQVTRTRTRNYGGQTGTVSSPLNDTGSLAQSVRYELRNIDRNTYAFQIKGNSYAHAIEDGSEGNVSVTGKRRLKDWARRKLGLNDAGASRAAYFIARKLRQQRHAVPFITQAMEKKEGGLGNLILGGIVEKDVAENIEQILIEAGYAKKGDEFILQ